jgi:Flp pilus assembly protein TadG
MAMSRAAIRRERGQAVVEFALGASLFAALMTGTFQIGYKVYAYENLLASVRAGARYGAISPYDAGVPTVDSSPSSNFTTRVRNMTVYGDSAGAVNGAASVVPGLQPQHVLVDVAFRNAMPETVTITIHGFALDAIFGRWVANQKPSATFTYMGRYDPPAP